MSVSVGWQIYDTTENALLLGFVGLAQFMPALLLVLVTGLVADRFNRRLIMAICLAVEAGCAVALLLFANLEAHEVWPIFVVLMALGLARAFLNPATDSLAPNLVPPEALANAIAINASAWQLAAILGPAVGGLLYGVSPVVAYGQCGGADRRLDHRRAADPEAAAANVASGDEHGDDARRLPLHLARKDRARRHLAGSVRGAAGRRGSAAADLRPRHPARRPAGAGALARRPRPSAPSPWPCGWRGFPIRDHAGYILFGFVAAFGLFTVVFGLSTSLWISVPALALMGACDMVSVSLRETLMQLWTPDSVRGRVSAVNRVFIGASNELGEFRAGTVRLCNRPGCSRGDGRFRYDPRGGGVEPDVPRPARRSRP